MTSWDWCPTAQDKDSSEYRRNVIALWIIFGTSLFIILFYLFASYEAYKRTRHSSSHTLKTVQYCQANILSGLIVSMLAIAALDTNFPQTIEATFSAVVALSQASALGWLDFPPDARVADILSTKAPDLTALGLTLYASWKLQNDYFNDHPGSTTTKYPPFVLRSPWLPFCVCAGVNEAVMAVVCYHWLYLRHGGEPIRRSFRRLVRIASWIFALSSTTGAAIGMVLAYYGCTPFTWGLYAAPLAVVSGIIYSMFQTERRLQDFGADLEQKAQSLLSATEMNSPHRSRSGTR